jgi:hypothetical protein
MGMAWFYLPQFGMAVQELTHVFVSFASELITS